MTITWVGERAIQLVTSYVSKANKWPSCRGKYWTLMIWASIVAHIASPTLVNGDRFLLHDLCPFVQYVYGTLRKPCCIDSASNDILKGCSASLSPGDVRQNDRSSLLVQLPEIDACVFPACRHHIKSPNWASRQANTIHAGNPNRPINRVLIPRNRTASAK